LSACSRWGPARSQYVHTRIYTQSQANTQATAPPGGSQSPACAHKLHIAGVRFAKTTMPVQPASHCRCARVHEPPPQTLPSLHSSNNQQTQPRLKSSVVKRVPSGQHTMHSCGQGPIEGRSKAQSHEIKYSRNNSKASWEGGSGRPLPCEQSLGCALHGMCTLHVCQWQPKHGQESAETHVSPATYKTAPLQVQCSAARYTQLCVQVVQ
jgi:hypothetical protein